MANVVKLKRSAVSGKIPQTTSLELGELAVNTFDGNLFFKKDQSSVSDGYETIVQVATLDGEQLLSNKTILRPVITGSLDMSTSGTGLIDDQGSDGSSNQILISTGTGIRWVDNTAGNISGLNDVALNGLATGQILKYNGTFWVNTDEQAQVSSAVFAANALSDLGFVTDTNITILEDLEPRDGISDNGLGETDTYYNMGPIAIDGVVGLRNVDQSLKSDYVSYSIIFGF
jgi:hypothetical protein